MGEGGSEGEGDGVWGRVGGGREGVLVKMKGGRGCRARLSVRVRGSARLAVLAVDLEQRRQRSQGGGGLVSTLVCLHTYICMLRSEPEGQGHRGHRVRIRVRVGSSCRVSGQWEGEVAAGCVGQDQGQVKGRGRS